MSDGNDFLMRGGTPAVKFPVLGTTVIGVVTKQPKVADVTDPATGDVKRYQNGDARKQVIIELQTELRESEDDGGERTLWVKGQMQVAVRDAVRKAGAKGIQVGGVLQVTYSSEKPNPPLQAQKIFTAAYWPPEQVPVEIPAAPWEQPPAQGEPGGWAARQPTAPPPPQAPPARPQVTVQARPMSTPPAQQPDSQLSFLERLKQTTAGQQAHQEQRRNHQGQPQDDEPPF